MLVLGSILLAGALYALVLWGDSRDGLSSLRQITHHSGSALAANIEAGLAFGDERHVKQLVGQMTSLPNLVSVAFVGADGRMGALTIPDGDRARSDSDDSLTVPSELVFEMYRTGAGLVAGGEQQAVLWGLFPVQPRRTVDAPARRSGGYVALAMETESLRKAASDRALVMAALFLLPLLLLSLTAVVVRTKAARRFEGLLRDARAELVTTALPAELEAAGERGGPHGTVESVVRTLLDSRRSLAQAFDALPVPVWSIDLTGACIYCNQAWLHFTGDTRARVVGDGWLRSVHPDDLAKRRGVLLNALQLGAPFSEEFRLLSSDGRFHRVRECGTPVFGRDGALTGMVATCCDLQPDIDVAEAVAARAAGEAARVEALTALNRELESFAYTVSHDLKVPLRAIDGYSHLLLTDHADHLDREGREFVACIRAGVARMATLIDDLLSYSRAERNVLRLRQLALGDVVEAVLAERSADLDGARACIEIDVKDIIVTADRASITQVMRNLIDNALKYSRNAMPQRVGIVATYRHDKVRISVRDNGVGFDMAHADRIFSVFTRLHREDDFAGSGVGLAIVRKAVQRMGGRVWAEGMPGKGACFHLELPR